MNEVFNDYWAASDTRVLFCSCMLFVVVEPETTVCQCCIYLDVVCLFMRGEGIVEQDDLRAY